jgi:hypothetical protein
MMEPEKPEPPTPTEESDSDLYVRQHPLLVRDTEDEDDLREGETILTFLAPPPDGDA